MRWNPLEPLVYGLCCLLGGLLFFMTVSPEGVGLETPSQTTPCQATEPHKPEGIEI